jgi:hypothetical protein
MLQLKRTVEVITVLNTDDSSTLKGESTKVDGARGQIKTLLKSALSAGKAARNERIVPQIKKLKEYGSDGTPPSALAKEVANVRNCIRS